MTEVAAEIADATLAPAVAAAFEIEGIDAEIHALGIVRAFCLTANQVVVELSEVPLDVRPFTPGGITNAKNWTITPYEPAARARLVQDVQFFLDAAAVEASPQALQLARAEPPFVIVSFDGPLAPGVRHKLIFQGEVGA